MTANFLEHSFGAFIEKVLPFMPTWQKEGGGNRRSKKGPPFYWLWRVAGRDSDFRRASGNSRDFPELPRASPEVPRRLPWNFPFTSPEVRQKVFLGNAMTLPLATQKHYLQPTYFSQRAQRSKKIEVSSDIEDFEREWNFRASHPPRPYLLGEIRDVEIEVFERD